MIYPPQMTAFDIMQFEYEYNKYLDIQHNEGQFWELNSRCQILSDEEKENEIFLTWAETDAACAAKQQFRNYY